MLFSVKSLILLFCFIFKPMGATKTNFLTKVVDPDIIFNVTIEDDIRKLFTPITALKFFQNNDFGENVSTQCLHDFKTSATEFVKGKVWAIQMFDAYGKIGSGISQGNFVWPGRFSVCKDVVQDLSSNDSSAVNEKPFRGQYCWLQINSKIQINKLFDKKNVQIKLGLCVPDSCTSTDLNNLIQVIIAEVSPTVNKYANATTKCLPSERNIWRDKRAVICLVFLFLVATVILSGTFYDIYQQEFISSSHDSKSKSFMPLNGNRYKIEIKPDTLEKCENDLPFELITEKLLLINEENDEFIRTKNEVNTKTWQKFLLCFSLHTNGAKLFSFEQRDNSLMCLDGIRVLSMIWIILAHTYLICFLSKPDNFVIMREFADSLWYLFVAAGIFSVDTFFVLSGLLITFLYLKKSEKKDIKINWLQFFVHQYWRLTPVYAVVIIIFANIMTPYYSSDPFWPLQSGLKGDSCDKYWWAHLLYINNFLPRSEQCMIHTWFLATNMQFFLLSPLILICLKRSIPIFAAIAGSFILTSWISSGIITSHYHFGFAIEKSLLSKHFLFLFYEKPYCRFDSFVIGMISGYLLHRSKLQHKLNKNVVILGWLFATGFCFSLIFGVHNTDPPQYIQSLYFALSRSTWSTAIAWMIYACCNGYGGFVNRILSWSFWQPLGRLTYSTYLIHYLIIHMFYQSNELPPHYSHLQVLSTFLTATISTYFLAIFLSLAFEAPFIALEKIILHKK